MDYFIELVASAPAALSMGVLVFASFIEYIFPPFPGDTIVVGGGFLAAQGAIPVLNTVVALTVGSVLGATLSWSLGYWWAARLVSEANIRRVHALYAKFGNGLIVVNRFIPGIRGLFLFAAGGARLSLWRVLLFGTLSAILWNSLLIGVGYFLGLNFEQLIHFVFAYSVAVYILMAIVVAVLLGYYFYGKRKHP